MAISQCRLPTPQKRSRRFCLLCRCFSTFVEVIIISPNYPIVLETTQMEHSLTTRGGRFIGHCSGNSHPV